MPLAFQNRDELEQKLKDGEVIELALPADATGLLLQDESGEICFVWQTCFHGQGQEAPRVPFETVDQVLLWSFSQLFSRSMPRQEARRCYSDISL